MKVIKSSVSILEQEPGIDGMKKHIERVGRVAYKSEDKITEDSYIRFLQMIYDRGHWAVFNLGSVYLLFPSKAEKAIFGKLKSTSPFTRWMEKDGKVYLTTNYRVICQLGLEEFMEKYWSEPSDLHYHRSTAHFICNRSTSHQLVRSRNFSFVQESQRYCNYSKGRFGNELVFILPQWVYRVRQDIANTVDSLTKARRTYIMSKDGEKLWNELTIYDRTVSGRDDFWRACEKEYFAEMITDEGEILKPEEARGILCNDVKTEICMCGYLEDWYYTPSKDTKEKAGFFYLRCAPDAQEDIRVLANSLKQQFEDAGYDKLK